MYELITHAITDLLLLYVIRDIKYVSVRHRQLLASTDVYFILFLIGCFATLSRTLLDSLKILIYLFLWFDTVLYRLYSVEVRVDNLHIVFSTLRHEAISMKRTKQFLKLNRTFAVLALLLILFNWLSISNFIRIPCLLIVCHVKRIFTLILTLSRSKRRILVIMPGLWDQDMLNCSELKSKYAFITVDHKDFCDFQKSKSPRLFGSIHHSLRKLIDKYRGCIDGVIGTGELPGCIFSSYIGTEFGLCNPSLKELLHISHKYYSRMFQQTIVPDAVPPFALISLSGNMEFSQLHYPFFVKPVKACTSMFAQIVRNDIELREATTFSVEDRINNLIWYESVNQLIEYCFGSSAISSFRFIGEGLLSGQQVTVECFIQNGQVTIMGITDSIMYPNTTSFQRFEYPSSLPNSVQTRMAEITSHIIGASNLNYTCLNLEFFYNKMNDSVSIIEINSRMSYQFSDLFYWVHGQSLFAVQLSLAVGEKVKWIPCQGDYQVAASFVMRRFSDAYVLQTPTNEQLARVYHTFSAINIKILCEKGQRLSEIRQDVSSYRYAVVNLAAHTVDELHKAYASVKEILTFTFENIQ